LAGKAIRAPDLSKEKRYFQGREKRWGGPEGVTVSFEQRGGSLIRSVQKGRDQHPVKQLKDNQYCR